MLIISVQWNTSVSIVLQFTQYLCFSLYTMYIAKMVNAENFYDLCTLLRQGGWKWGEHKLPKASNYSYLGIDFASNGAWDVHLKKVLDNGRKKVNQLHSVISNRDINLSARRLLLLSVIRPSIEYGGEVWEGNKSQVDALESIILGGAKRILGCSSKTCIEAVRGDMGIETLKSRRDRAKLKWWYKLATMPEDRSPKQLFSQEWDQKPRRGRQRKTWGRVIGDLLVSLGLDKVEWLEDSD